MPLALERALEGLVREANAEAGYLLSEVESGSANSSWELVASSQSENSGRLGRKDLFSNTILQEALRKRAPVCVESIIGHPWSSAESVIDARIFSAACFPLILGDRVFGAVFLLSRTPGKSIRREVLPELGLLATHIALLMALRS